LDVPRPDGVPLLLLNLQLLRLDVDRMLHLGTRDRLTISVSRRAAGLGSGKEGHDEEFDHLCCSRRLETLRTKWNSSMLSFNVNASAFSLYLGPSTVTGSLPVAIIDAPSKWARSVRPIRPLPVRTNTPSLPSACWVIRFPTTIGARTSTRPRAGLGPPGTPWRGGKRSSTSDAVRSALTRWQVTCAARPVATGSLPRKDRRRATVRMTSGGSASSPIGALEQSASAAKDSTTPTVRNRFAFSTAGFSIANASRPIARACGESRPRFRRSWPGSEQPRRCSHLRFAGAKSPS